MKLLKQEIQNYRIALAASGDEEYVSLLNSEAKLLCCVCSGCGLFKGTLCAQCKGKGYWEQFQTKKEEKKA